MASSEFRRTRRRFGQLAAVASVLFATASCTHSASVAGGQFNDQKRVDVRCLDHQAQRPGTAYTGGTKADTSKILVLLHYYVANGGKPYCDGAQASNIDRSWAQLYVTLGGNPQLVTHILGP